MGQFFDKFPVIPYQVDKNNDRVPQYDIATNILVRIGIIKTVLDKVFNYYEYSIRDGDSPEGLAEKIYGTPEAHWIILLTNNIMDPQYDWPMNYDVMNKFLISKYGSIAASQTTVDHYEIITQTVDIQTNTTYQNKNAISLEEYTASLLPVSMGAPTAYTVGNSVVDLWQWKTIVYAYDQEILDNDARRNIKIIKPDYYQEIMSQFGSLMVAAGASNLNSRTLF